MPLRSWAAVSTCQAAWRTTIRPPIARTSIARDAAGARISATFRAPACRAPAAPRARPRPGDRRRAAGWPAQLAALPPGPVMLSPRRDSAARSLAPFRPSLPHPWRRRWRAAPDRRIVRPQSQVMIEQVRGLQPRGAAGHQRRHHSLPLRRVLSAAFARLSNVCDSRPSCQRCKKCTPTAPQQQPLRPHTAPAN